MRRYVHVHETPPKDTSRTRTRRNDTVCTMMQVRSLLILSWCSISLEMKRCCHNCVKHHQHYYHFVLSNDRDQRRERENLSFQDYEATQWQVQRVTSSHQEDVAAVRILMLQLFSSLSSYLRLSAKREFSVSWHSSITLLVSIFEGYDENVSDVSVYGVA